MRTYECQFVTLQDAPRFIAEGWDVTPFRRPDGKPAFPHAAFRLLAWREVTINQSGPAAEMPLFGGAA